LASISAAVVGVVFVAFRELGHRRDEPEAVQRLVEVLGGDVAAEWAEREKSVAGVNEL